MTALAHAEFDAALPRLPLEPDLFGRVLMDAYQGVSDEYFLRRDDNFLQRDSSLRYFATWEKMPAHHRCLLSHARGHVLDLGAGAGQHSLALQARGLAVTAVDSSPLAVEVCRAQGVQDARVGDAFTLDLPPASVDTLLLMHNSLGLAGTPEGLRQLLRRWHALVRPGGQILADLTVYTATREAAHLRYHALNRARGRYPGSVRLRIEYGGTRGPDFDWLLLTLADLRGALADTGWRIARCVQVDPAGLYAVGMARE